MDRIDPQAALERLDAKFSLDLDAYAAGEIDAAQIRCVLCHPEPCACTGEIDEAYVNRVNALHRRNRG